jgi:excisionase family DNA binding protein
MNIEFDPEDIEKVSNRVAEIVLENLKETQNSSLVDTDGLAAYLNVSKSWVYEKTRDKGNGSIPRVKVGKYVRFNIHDVLEWLKRQ